MDDFEYLLEKYKEVGYVTSLVSFVATVSGLPDLKDGELVLTESGARGLVVGLKENEAEVLILEEGEIKVGERVVRSGEPFKIGVSQNLLGRIINPLSQPVDGKGPIKREKFCEIQSSAPSVIERKRINENLETGVAIVDLLIPIGYGQRELVIGDAKTGKTIFLLQTIANQVRKGVVCVYVGIGKKDVAIRQVEEYLKKQGVFEKVVIVYAPADDPPPLLYLAPYSGMTIAEYFRNLNKKVLIVFDDLTTHAQIYRQISLILKRPPGRDCYPGDTFHIHASLLERAGCIKKDGKEMSITALPVAETFEGDISGYIQTNLMAMTDGHIFFDINEFRKGKRPAINPFLSVSRVGIQTKTQVEKELANWIREKLYAFEQVSELRQLATELPKETQRLIDLARKIEIILQQSPQELIERGAQIILFGLLLTNFWENKPESKLIKEKETLLKLWGESKVPQLREKISEIKGIEHLKFLIEEIKPEIEKLLKENANT